MIFPTIANPSENSSVMNLIEEKYQSYLTGFKKRLEEEGVDLSRPHRHYVKSSVYEVDVSSWFGSDLHNKTKFKNGNFFDHYYDGRAFEFGSFKFNFEDYGGNVSCSITHLWGKLYVFDIFVDKEIKASFFYEDHPLSFDKGMNQKSPYLYLAFATLPVFQKGTQKKLQDFYHGIILQAIDLSWYIRVLGVKDNTLDSFMPRGSKQSALSFFKETGHYKPAYYRPLKPGKNGKIKYRHVKGHYVFYRRHNVKEIGNN